MYKKMLWNFSAGVDLATAPLQLGLDSSKTPWASGINVEIYNRMGVCRQNGNRLITTAPDNAGVNSIFSYEPAANPTEIRILYTTLAGDFYEYDVTKNEHTLLKSGLKENTPCVYTKFLNGVAVSNGYDEPFYYKCEAMGGSASICEMNTVAKDGESPILATAVCAFKSRLWLAAGDTLYYSALGTFDDWETFGDAGYISNFHCDSSPVTAMRPYKDYLAVYKQNQTYLLSGFSADDFEIVPFSDKGASSANAVVTAANKQYFFADALFALEQTGLLAQISLGDEASLNIKPVLRGDSGFVRTVKDSEGTTYFVHGSIDRTRLSSVIIVPYEPKNQLWFYLPTQNNPYINNIWIYDILNRAWTLRALPQPVLCAANYGVNVISGLADGRILIEDRGNTFDGEPITFEWKTPFLTLGNPNSRKILDEFYFLISDNVDNNFDFRAYKDYDTLDAQDNEVVTVDNYQNLIWAADSGSDERCCWAQETVLNETSLEEELSELGALEDNINNDEDYETSNEEIASGLWAVPCETAQKVEVSGSCLAVQFCVSGSKTTQNFAILALEYKEITPD